MRAGRKKWSHFVISLAIAFTLNPSSDAFAVPSLGVGDGRGAPAPEPRVDSKEIRLAFEVFFDLDSAALDRDAKKVIREAIKKVEPQLKDNSKVTVQVTGWVQPTRVSPNVLQLSRSRANAVVKEMKRLGLKAKYVVNTPGEDSKNIAKSRRATVVITIRNS